MKIGRPPKNRISGTGEKLFHALKLCGLSWGTRINSPNHVLNNERWLHLELPRSTKTLMQDIRDGISEDRLVKYLTFFDVDANYFIDSHVNCCSEEFKNAILNSRKIFAQNASFHFSGDDALVNSELYKQNNSDAIENLFGVMSGIYLVYLKDISLDIVLKVAMFISKKEKFHLRAILKSKIFDIDLNAEAMIFKCGTFLHMNYYTQCCYIVGYMVMQDPTCVPYLLYHKPLTFDLYGISSGIVSTAVPNRFYGFAEKQFVPVGRGSVEHYLHFCQEIENSPKIMVSDPCYNKILERIDLAKRKTIEIQNIER